MTTGTIFWLSKSSTDYGFQKNDRLPQYRFEAVLRRRMASLPLVDARFGWAAQYVAKDKAIVRVHASFSKQGTARTNSWKPIQL